MKSTEAVAPQIAALPESVRTRLAELAASLEQGLGADLVGIIVHGSAARGDYRPGESDVEVVVVLQRAALAQLEAIGNALQRARYGARIEAMILVESEIAGASDVFPLLYDEILRCRVVLAGRDPFTSVVVAYGSRRLAIERELREAQIRLRRTVADAFGAPEAIGGAVARKVTQLHAPLRALLALKGIHSEVALPAVLEQAGATYGVDVGPLRAAREAPDPALAALVELLDKMVADVDAMGSDSAEGK